MASASGANFVKYFFYAGNTIPADRKQALISLAYATARDQMLAPQAILIRADIHNTTTINGQIVKDPNGWHGTFAFKDGQQLKQKSHITTHGYTNGKGDFILKAANHSTEKKDSTPRRGDKTKVVWPEEERKLEEFKDNPIAYSHLP